MLHIDDAIKIRNECEAWCTDEPSCWGCSAHCVWGAVGCVWNALSRCESANIVFRPWYGLIEGDVTKKIVGKCTNYIISKKYVI